MDERTTEVWTARAVRDAAAEIFRKRGIGSARLDADVLLAHALSITRLELLMQMDRPLTEAERDRYRDLVKERARRVPAAYLTGSRGFYGLDLEVTRDVLVPRPETELVVERAIDHLRGAGLEGAFAADIGTGSGAIAVALLHEAKAALARVHAVDRSAAALAVAARNAERAGVADRLTLHEGDLLAPLLAAGLEGSLDLVLSNPPYVAERDRGRLDPELAHEPAEALFSGPDGLDCLRRLIPGARRVLRPGGLLLCEVGYDQRDAVIALARTAGYTGITFHQDLGGIDRVLAATAPA